MKKLQLNVSMMVAEDINHEAGKIMYVKKLLRYYNYFYGVTYKSRLPTTVKPKRCRYIY